MLNGFIKLFNINKKKNFLQFFLFIKNWNLKLIGIYNLARFIILACFIIKLYFFSQYNIYYLINCHSLISINNNLDINKVTCEFWRRNYQNCRIPKIRYYGIAQHSVIIERYNYHHSIRLIETRRMVVVLWL